MKAQISLEFIFVILVLLTVFYVAVSIKDRHTFQTDELVSDISAKQVCDSMSTTIDKVYISGKGTRAKINLPPRLETGDYTIHFSPEKAISVSHEHGTIFCTFKTKVSHENSDSFDLGKGEHILHNTGEVVEII